MHHFWEYRENTFIATDTQIFCPADMAGQKQYALKEHRQFIRWCVHQWIRSFVCVRLCVSSEHSERVANFYTQGCNYSLSPLTANSLFQVSK
ncbi:MAG: hypothetical protein J7K15_11290, partial [Deltaproteobacteria bacterium]|nr:hypothetical protein [Deltaproteobacteria bacterium]